MATHAWTETNPRKPFAGGGLMAARPTGEESAGIELYSGRFQSVSQLLMLDVLTLARVVAGRKETKSAWY